jgi:hypothetical protein
MREPEVGRRLTREESALMETCRACTAVDPGRRPGSAGVVVGMLAGEGRRGRRLGRRWQAAIAFALLAVVAIAAGVAVRGVRRARVGIARADSPTIIVPTGDPEEWTDKSRVLAEVPGMIHCMVDLPDHRTVRFVWGTPPQAVDIDTRTGARRPSPVLPATYAEGCPDLSPDGHRLLFQGRDKDGRPLAFVSPYSDGRAASPVTPIADPSVNSEPLWLPDGKSFVHDVDVRHVGVFSLAAERTTVLPEPTLPAFLGTWHWRSNGDLFVTAHDSALVTEVVAYSLPQIAEKYRLRISVFALNFRSTEWHSVVCAGFKGFVIEIDPVAGEARNRGELKGQFIRQLTPIASGLAFASTRIVTTVVNVEDDSRVIRSDDRGLLSMVVAARGTSRVRWWAIGTSSCAATSPADS